MKQANEDGKSIICHRITPYRNGIASRIAPINLTKRNTIRAAKAPTMTTLTHIGRKLQKEASV